MKIEGLLHKEIADEFEILGKMDVGTDKYKTAVDGLSKLMDKAIELDKLNVEHNNQEFEIDFKERQAAEEKKDRMVKNGIAVAGIVIPSLLTIWGTIKSIKFEQEGTITTIMGRGFINKLLPKK